ncbi:MAG TPA: protease inhibitor I42 family protein [Desulfobacteria bacterium]|nr:protease inhibitor I42 family protein [Desulfobacteria bacterium]
MEKRTYIVGGALIAILIIVVLLLAYVPREGGNQASGAVQLAATDNGRTIKLTIGQVVTITLEANPTTGYTWDVVEPLSGPVMRQVGEIEFESESDAIGAGGVQTVRFEVVNAGQTALTLVYHRPWETDVEPLKTFAIHVVAR